MARNVKINCSVYGSRDGLVAFLDMPDGVIPPPRIAHMSYLGEVPDVVTRAVNALRPRPQQALADLLGTRQQYISRWINAEAAPVLSDEQWAKLIQTFIGAS